MSRRQYSDAFKREAVAMVADGQSVEAVARALSMPSGSLWNWVTRSHRPDDPTASAPETDDPITIAALQRRIADLEQEVEFLGKASAYFARNIRR